MQGLILINLFVITWIWKNLVRQPKEGGHIPNDDSLKSFITIIEKWFSLFLKTGMISLDKCQSDFFVDRLRYSIEKQKEERARKGSWQVSAGTARIPFASRRKTRFFFFFFSSQMPLCFIGRLRLLFSCPSPTTVVDKRMTISWTLAGVTGETSRRLINNYFITLLLYFSGKSRLQDMHLVIVPFTFCEKNMTWYVIFTCKIDKTFTIKIIIALLYHKFESLVGIIQHLASSSPLPHLKCIVRASCISHATE